MSEIVCTSVIALDQGSGEMYFLAQREIEELNDWYKRNKNNRLFPNKKIDL